MAEYWYQRAEGDQVEGPCTGAQLKVLAVAGDITPNSMITADGTTWHRAGRVAKLFPPPSAASAAPAPPQAPAAPVPQYAPAPQYAAAPQYAPAVAPPVGLQYASPRQQSVAVGWVGKPRGILPFLLLSLVLLASNVAAGISVYTDVQARSPDFTLPAMLFLSSFVIGIATLIYWLVLVYAAHQDMRNFTGGTYSVSPGAAVGLSFVPAFSAYWVVYMPWKLLKEVRLHLRERGGEVSPGLVLAFQAISIPLLFIGPGAVALMYALSMMHIQKGLNALWRQAA